ncbi:MAG: amidase [Planctomycetaceae bacterium]
MTRKCTDLTLTPAPDETIEGAAADLRAGKVTSVELVERCLARIDRWEIDVQAWVIVDRDGVRKQAEQCDRERKSGNDRGALHGIPIGIKDIIDVAGFPTAAGSKARANTIVKQDAPVVARLRAAGAVILGKTVTTQFASFDPPPTRNPWNFDRTPGGSSSGSAAAVAVGMCLGALGSQTGGSITRPASYCGVMGCKPSYGRVTLEGIVPLAPSLDHPGPMAKSVRGMAILLDAISQDGSEFPSLVAATESSRKNAPRIGRLHGLFDALADSEVRSATDRSIAQLVAADAEVRDASLPEAFQDVIRRHRTMMAVEVATDHEERLAKMPDDYLPNVRSLIEEGLKSTPTEYVRSRKLQTQLRHEIESTFDGYDVLACPATTSPAPDVATTGDPAFNSPWSYLGLPTVCLPIALSSDGLPLGLQLVARTGDETTLFAAAHWCESVLIRDLSR